MTDHPITPPPELVQQLIGGAFGAMDQSDFLDPEKLSEALRILATRAALAQPEPVAPTDEELLMLMPETMRDEFSYAAKTCSDAMGGRVKRGIFRVALNTAALEYARAVLARCGTANNTINQEDYDG